ncbi:hypothetical protein MBBA_2138 [Methanoculleus bourgensis]|nr:hypothetical protein MBBA_2138 [Methanoculleus bourgensis]
MNARYSTDVEYGFTTLYTPNYGICHNICGTLNISFAVDRVSDVSKRHHNAGKRPEYARIQIHSRITAVHTSPRIKTLLREYRRVRVEEGAPGTYQAGRRAPCAHPGTPGRHPRRRMPPMRSGGFSTPARQPLSMRIIRAPTLARAHELAVRTVLEKGWVLETENEEATIECDELALEVAAPESAPMVSPASRFQQRFLDAYAENLLRGSDAKFEYDYHRRLFDWGERLSAGGEDVHVDQIDYIARKLTEAPTTRRAVAITWNPVVDENLDDCPCLQLVQCLLRDGKVEMKVVFRSNDILSAAGSNMYALVHLQKAIADRVGAALGRYTHIALVPHVYYLRDLDDIEPFCKLGTAIQPIAEVCRACRKCPRASRV